MYVCDRPNDRIQVFRKNGTFVKEKRIAPLTRGDGSVWDIAFSRDRSRSTSTSPTARTSSVYVIDRQSLEILTSFGDGGRQPGQFFAVHSIATDSKGNIYTTETYEGKRLQKFVYKGIGSVRGGIRESSGPGGKLRQAGRCSLVLVAGARKRDEPSGSSTRPEGFV